MTFPRIAIALLAILAATIGILLAAVVEPASRLDIPNNRPAKYYPTGPITPTKKDS